MKAVYKFYQEFGLDGSLDGVFIAEVADVEAAMGKEVYFGEALGRYSEVDCTITKENTVCASTDPAVVQVVEEYKLSSGWNPLDAMEETEDEDEDGTAD